MSRVAIPAVGLLSKLCLNLNRVTVSGLPILLDALDESRRKGRGVLTISNHISTIDDPFMWGALPLRNYFHLRDMRWALGASDIIFTNPIFSAFFRAGMTLKTFRGQGVYQPAIDEAIRKLDLGDWVHVFPEGRVNQFLINTTGRLFRFKWGVGRMLMETAETPTIIPMWLTGFDKIAPEPRIFKFIPRLGKKVSITIGDPQGMTERTDSILKEWRKSSDWRRRQRNSDEELLIRRRVTETLQEELEILEARVKSSQIP